jgi:predicted nucleic acid-binding protein
VSARVVVDASLAAAWVLPEAQSEAALGCAERWLAAGTTLHAPGLFVAELTNALHQRIRRGELSEDTARAALETIAAFDVELREEPGAPARALTLASSHSVPSTYDCYYLALAESHDCEFWTADERFFNAVRAREERVRWVGA